jgi:hypothetical protein
VGFLCPELCCAALKAVYISNPRAPSAAILLDVTATPPKRLFRDTVDLYRRIYQLAINYLVGLDRWGAYAKRDPDRSPRECYFYGCRRKSTFKSVVDSTRELLRLKNLLYIFWWGRIALQTVRGFVVGQSVSWGNQRKRAVGSILDTILPERS